MASRNPLRWSKGKLFLYTTVLLLLWIILSALLSTTPHSEGCSAPFLIFGLLTGTILVVKIARDQNAAIESRAARERYLQQQQQQLAAPPQTPTQKSSDGANVLRIPTLPSRDQ